MSSSLYSGVSGLALGAGLYGNVSGLWGGASGLVDGLNGSAYPGASLYLDFLSMTAPTFDSRITFSRGSNATVVDNTGRVTYAPANLLLHSGNLANATFWTNGPIANGTRTDGSVSVTADEGYAYIQSGGLAALVGQHIFSADVVCSQTIANVPIRFTAGAAAAFVLVNMVAGVSQRIFIALDAGTTVGTAVAFGIDARSAIVPGGSNATGYIVTFNNVQLEPVTYQTTPSAYVATTSAAYYGPRFDYDPVTLAPRGLLIEEQRTNLLTYSGDITDAVWLMLGTAGASRTANATTAPDGTSNADRYTVGTGTGAWYIANYANQNIVDGQAYTFSVYIKANGLNFVFVRPHNNSPNLGPSGFIVSLIDGAITYPSSPLAPASTGTATNVGNGWWRITATSTANGTVTPSTGGPGIWPCNSTAFSATSGTGPANFTGDGTSGIYIWGAQFEAGPFATSYIPTVASTVTRSADVATMTGTNFSSWYNQSEGTFVTDADSYLVDTTARTILTAYASGTPGSNLKAVNATQRQFQVSVSGTGQADLDAGDPVSNQPFKLAARYGTNDFAASVNGGAVATDTAGSLPTVNTMALGASEFDVNRLNGHIREIAYFNTRQSNTRLQTLTAPPLVTTLSLDFTSGTYLVGY